MTITSYSQNFEDVILWRALKTVKRGTYIDVGAQDPVIDSVSLAFYENGWRGVHVEPNPFYAEQIRKSRPDENVIEAAIGADEGTITFFEITDTGLSTGDADIAEMHRASGHAVKRIEVQCMPLSKVLEPYEGRDVHWLKIDVEGMEKQVIESWAASPVRPWIVVVESTKPNSPEPNYNVWEPSLLALEYEFVYFDGLNRFYVSAEHSELKSSFQAGPNVFDGFVLSGSSSASFSKKLNTEISESKREISSLRDQLHERTAEVVRLSRGLEASQTAFSQAAEAWKLASATLGNEIRLKNEDIGRLRKELALQDQELALQDQELARRDNEVARLSQQVRAIYGSTSWRITAPVRIASRAARWFLRGAIAWVMFKPGSRPHRIAVAVTKHPRPTGGNALGNNNDAVAESRPPAGSPSSAPESRGTRSGKDEKSPNLVVIAQLNPTDEPSGVLRTYRQLVHARKYHLIRE
jgi:FkbM family methyltransferase